MKRLHLVEIPEEFAFDSYTRYSVSDVMSVLLPRNGVIGKFGAPEFKLAHYKGSGRAFGGFD